MKITLFNQLDPAAMRLLLLINSKLERLLMNDEQMVAEIQAVEAIVKTSDARILKIGAETTVLLANVAALEAALANAGSLNHETVVAALNSLKANAQTLDDHAKGVDDQVPDAPAPVDPPADEPVV